MPKAYSQDLRARIVYISCKYKLSGKAIKQILKVDPKTIRNYCKYMELYGDYKSYSQMYGNKPRRKSYDADDLECLIFILMQNGGHSMESLGEILFLLTGKEFKINVIVRMIREILHSRKKASIRAKECDEVLISLHYIGLLGFDRNKMYFLDESHISNKNGACQFGYSLKGEPCVIRDEFVRRHRASIIGICGINGMKSHAIKPGSINMIQYRYFVFFCVIGVLQVGDKYILDNATIHKDHIIRTLLEILGIQAWWLPPYCPHLNPIELVWCGVKNKMRSDTLRPIARRDPIQAANIALESYYNKDLSALYKQCGY